MEEPSDFTGAAAGATTSDTHTRDRWRWLDQVMADPEVPPFAFKVAYVISSFVNRESGDAWPSQATLAEKTGSSDRWVRKAVNQLAAAGHLTINTPDGRKGVNHYRLTFGSERGEGGSLHRNDRSGKGQNNRNDRSYETPLHRNDRSGENAFHRNDRADFIGTIVPPIPLKEPSEYITPAPASRALPPKGQKPSRCRDTRISDDWTPQPKDVAYAAERGFSEAEIQHQAERFRDYWLAEGGPRARKHDWSVAWRNWCRNAPNQRPAAPGLLLPIAGGRHRHAANPSRPRSGSASAMAAMDAYPSPRQETRR